MNRPAFIDLAVLGCTEFYLQGCKRLLACIWEQGRTQVFLRRGESRWVSRGDPTTITHTPPVPHTANRLPPPPSFPCTSIAHPCQSFLHTDCLPLLQLEGGKGQGSVGCLLEAIVLKSPPPLRYSPVWEFRHLTQILKFELKTGCSRRG